ncbi:MAG: hypothetical protein PHU23_03310 [Dehalococcoidales bacterium]|nr:hypothetical protein [Dehalococcoidales bacterium]
MEIAATRDIVIIILGILYIILTIGLIVFLIIAYIKIRRLLRKANDKLFSVRRWYAYAHGLFKGFIDSVNVFRREGG